MPVVGLICTVSRKSTTRGKSPKPYAVVKADNGGSFCIFPKVGDVKAASIVEALPVGEEVVLSNVAIYEGGVLVYNNTTVE